MSGLGFRRDTRGRVVETCRTQVLGLGPGTGGMSTGESKQMTNMTDDGYTSARPTL